MSFMWKQKECGQNKTKKPFHLPFFLQGPAEPIVGIKEGEGTIEVKNIDKPPIG